MGDHLDIYHPEGQSSFTEVDNLLALDYLRSAGLEVTRALGHFGAGDFRGSAFLMDDDTVFTVKYRGLTDGATHEMPPSGKVTWTTMGHESLF